MFDWDRDYEATVRGRRIPVMPVTVPSLATGPVDASRRKHGRAVVFLASALVLGGGLAFLSTPGRIAIGLGEGPGVAFAASFAGVSEAVSYSLAPPESNDPPRMQIYGDREVAAFRNGAARIGDAELRAFADRLSRDLQTWPDWLHAELSDLLMLTEHELSRRTNARTAAELSGGPLRCVE